jgi:hypothetical protein
VVPVSRVKLGPDGDAEIFAGAHMSRTQEGVLGPVAFVIFGDCDDAPVRQLEAGNVDGVGERMLAAQVRSLAVADHVAAGVGAHVFEPGYASSKGR